MARRANPRVRYLYDRNEYGIFPEYWDALIPYHIYPKT